VAEKKPDAADIPGGLSELKDRVARATKLIAELREANHSLKSEVAELHRKLEAMEPATASPAAAAAAVVHEELQQLRDERKIIRAKVQNLVERIERIDL
jgi:predicted  nucleic acid-binding Zn-ribbon protein